MPDNHLKSIIEHVCAEAMAASGRSDPEFCFCQHVDYSNYVLDADTPTETLSYANGIFFTEDGGLDLDYPYGTVLDAIMTRLGNAIHPEFPNFYGKHLGPRFREWDLDGESVGFIKAFISDNVTVVYDGPEQEVDDDVLLEDTPDPMPDPGVTVPRRSTSSPPRPILEEDSTFD